MEKLFLTSVMLFFLQSPCVSQGTEVQRGATSISLPHSLKYPGKVKDILQWTDKQGRHLLLLSEAIKVSRNAALAKDAELYAGHYLDVGGNWELQWKVSDFERGCPLDVGATFILESVEITDLDKDGISEVSFMYRTFCTGGIDPHSLKLIMYAGNKKLAIRGETLVRLPQQPAYGGSTTMDSSFQAVSRELKDFALDQWDKYRTHPR